MVSVPEYSSTWAGLSMRGPRRVAGRLDDGRLRPLGGSAALLGMDKRASCQDARAVITASADS